MLDTVAPVAVRQSRDAAPASWRHWLRLLGDSGFGSCVTVEAAGRCHACSKRRSEGSIKPGRVRPCSSSWESWNSATRQSLRSSPAAASSRWPSAMESAARHCTAGCRSTPAAASAAWPTPHRDRHAAHTARRRLPEARIVELRLAHPRWGPRTIAHYLAREEPRALSLALLDLPLPGTPSPDRSPEAPPKARGLPPLGALQGHGALADGRDGRRAPQ